MVAATSTRLDAGSHCPASRRLTAPTLIVPRVVPGIVSVDSVANPFWLVERPKLRFAITSGVGGAQPRAAVSKKAKLSAMCGRVLGTWCQHFSVSVQTSFDRPRMSKFVGREGRIPARASPGAA